MIFELSVRLRLTSEKGHRRMGREWLKKIVQQNQQQKQDEQLHQQVQLENRRRFNAQVGPLWMRFQNEVLATVDDFNRQTGAGVLAIEYGGDQISIRRTHRPGSASIVLDREREEIECAYVPALPNGVNRKVYKIDASEQAPLIREEERQIPITIDELVESLLSDFLLEV
jgi:hypothetical protein